VGNFLRFAALILLVMIGFGGGICGLFGLGAVIVEQVSGERMTGAMDFTGVALALSAIGLVVAALCIWGIRVLARSLKRTAQAEAAGAVAPPPSPPPSPPPPAA
jgi:hypothetical protein